VQPIGSELKGAIAAGILRAALEREPTASELASVLAATLEETDPARFAEAVLRLVPRKTPPVLLELARSAVMLEAELAAIKSSLSWRLGGVMRVGGRKLPPSVRLAMREAAIWAYRGTRTGLWLARAGSSRVPALLGRTGSLKAATVSELPPLDDGRARANAARWCTHESPVVSIIIVNWNAAELTARSVRHLWQVTTGTRYEILLVDNGSAPREAAQLAKLASCVRVLALGVNRYFGEANNIAAERAAGAYLCFLNNDAFPREGWLDPLLEALRADPAVGAAGPKFLFPDGRLQEAGAAVDENGYPVRFGRLLDAPADAFSSPREVDYISAAALLVPKALFEAVGGFDLTFEPAYYEDTDLCFRLRLLGRTVQYCPASEVMHIEGARTDDRARAAYRKALGDCNREKFVARWGDYLRERSQADLDRSRASLILAPPPKASREGSVARSRPVAEIFTPYPLTPGGGERYILTLASVLSRHFAVTIVTPFAYSQLRLATLGREFQIDVAACRMATYDPSAARPDLWVAMGNHIVPSVPARGHENWYVCQFPFEMEAAALAKERANLGGYQRMLVYSNYTRVHVGHAFGESGVAPVPVRVVYPPVPILGGDPTQKDRTILSVGRFFAGGHSKRHDVMLEAFRELLGRIGGGVELHLAGSSSPLQPNMEYVAQLRTMAADLPVRFHLNPSPQTLRALYARAPIYWHATGYGLPPDDAGEKAEHFGISIVEAMSAGCVPLAYAAGGPCEIIEDGVSGFLYDSSDLLLSKTAVMLEAGTEAYRIPIARRAAAAARRYSAEVFADAVRDLVREAGLMPAQSPPEGVLSG
jgi:GT2 family glycosyltransferase/glycosyltransferase involved in cell wall biosynthesis